MLLCKPEAWEREAEHRGRVGYRAAPRSPPPGTSAAAAALGEQGAGRQHHAHPEQMVFLRLSAQEKGWSVKCSGSVRNYVVWAEKP